MWGSGGKRYLRRSSDRWWLPQSLPQWGLGLLLGVGLLSLSLSLLGTEIRTRYYSIDLSAVSAILPNSEARGTDTARQMPTGIGPRSLPRSQPSKAEWKLWRSGAMAAGLQ
jgi:hypothetical protein